ncbi:MAG: hypothetical protein ACREID_00815, partial [Planctomycetota bacterium]
MIFNAFSVLAAFAALLRVALGATVLFLGLRAVRAWRRRSASPAGPDEERFYLLVVLTSTVVALGVASWPLLYLVLQSYVPEWPGVMCIRGVTRIGTGSVGAASLLPGLVQFLEATKPVLVFAAGTWLVLHLANRSDRAASLTGRVLAALLLCGAVATVDGAGELAYLLIPKQEKFLAAGCCTVGADAGAWSDARPFPDAGASGGGIGLTAVFFSVGGAVVAALSA